MKERISIRKKPDVLFKTGDLVVRRYPGDCKELERRSKDLFGVGVVVKSITYEEYIEQSFLSEDMKKYSLTMNEKDPNGDKYLVTWKDSESYESWWGIELLEEQ